MVRDLIHSDRTTIWCIDRATIDCAWAVYQRRNAEDQLRSARARRIQPGWGRGAGGGCAGAAGGGCRGAVCVSWLVAGLCGGGRVGWPCSGGGRRRPWRFGVSGHGGERYGLCWGGGRRMPWRLGVSWCGVCLGGGWCVWRRAAPIGYYFEPGRRQGSAYVCDYRGPSVWQIGGGWARGAGWLAVLGW